MNYNKQPFGVRYGTMGDAAENAFERWAIVKGYDYVRRGWDRPPLDRFYEVHPTDRATPDFLLQTPDNTYYVDCKGTVYDHVKIKQESIDALKHWNQWHPVLIFVWNSKLRKSRLLNFEFVAAILNKAEPQSFKDGKEYYEFSIDWDEEFNHADL